MKIDKKVMEANNVRNEGKPQFTVTAARRSKDGSLLLTRCKYIVEAARKCLRAWKHSTAQDVPLMERREQDCWKSALAGCCWLVLCGHWQGMCFRRGKGTSLSRTIPAFLDSRLKALEIQKTLLNVSKLWIYGACVGVCGMRNLHHICTTNESRGE